LPIINTSLNKSLDDIKGLDIINITANATDNVRLGTGQIIVNESGFIRYFNFSLSGTSDTFSQNITITSIGVVNFTARVNDSANNFATNDTIVEVTNTPPFGLNILVPSNNQYTSLQPLDLNVTFAEDAEGQPITINYYINGKLNDSTATNTTFNASDGYYILNVSITDSFDPSANATVNFTIDTINPIIKLDSPENNSLNPASFTAKITPADTNLGNCTLYHNFSGAWKANVTIQNANSGSQNSLPALTLNDSTFVWDVLCNDLAGNNAFNGSNFTIRIDATPPIVNATLNKSLSNITVNDIINITANATDINGLSFGQIIVNDTGIKRYFNFSLSGTSDTFSQNITITLTRGGVINFTARTNDTVNNIRTNDAIITVANTPPTGLSILFPTNNLYTTLQPLEFNVTFAEDPDGDTTTINYYINGKLNDSTTFNTTFNASDGYYILNVSITDSVDHHDNVTINFTIDTTTVALTLNIGPNPAEFAFENVSINFTASDDNLGAVKVNVTFPNGSLLAEYTANFTLNTTNLTVIGNYTITLFANDSAGNSNTLSKDLKVQDTTPPSAFDLSSPADGTRSMNLTPHLDWEDTVEANFENYTIEFSTSNIFTFVNFTYKAGGNVSNSSMDITTSLTPNLNWTWRVIAYDKAGQSRTITTAFRYETFENTPPTIPNNTLPSNNTLKIYNNINFTWTQSTDADNDDITYDLLIARDTAFTDIDLNKTGIKTNHFDLKENGSVLSGGTRYWEVRAYDNLNNSSYSNYFDLKVIVAILNITAPTNNTKFYPANTTEITISELNNTQWINNVTIQINNTDYIASNTSNIWSVNVTFSSLTPQYMNITAYGFNQTSNLTTTAYRTIIFSKADTYPKITYVCSNETYALNSTNTTISLKSSLDTLINITNVTITNPSGITIQLNSTSSAKDNLVYTHNYLHFLNETGNYTLNATVLDIEGKTFNKSSVFYVSTAVKTINITGINLTAVNINDVCGSNTITNGISIIATIPEDAFYNVEIRTAKPTLIFNNLNLTNTTNLLNYTGLAKNISAPSGQRIITEFEINTNLTKFDNITVSYNYTDDESGLDDETGLRMYKCSSQASCTFSLLTTTLNTTTNIISTVVNSLSVFLVSETATTTTTETVTTTTTVSAGGGGSSSSGGGTGGGSIVTRLASLGIIVPSPISINARDSLTVPLILKNTGQVTLKDINLSYELNAEGVTIQLQDTYFDSLAKNESVTTKAIITTDIENITNESRKGVKIIADVGVPSITESVEIIIDIIDITKENRTKAGDRIKFASDIFENNPECLELKELLAQAETALGNKEFRKALVLAESAINACRQLIGEGGIRPVVRRPSRIGFKITLPLIIAILLVILALVIYGARNISWRMPRVGLGFRFTKRKHKHRIIGPTKKELKTFEDEEKQIRRMLRGER
jgi:hypothetical protein